MPDKEPYNEVGERPIEAAARVEAERQSFDSDEDERAEREADMLVADIDDYVAETDPGSQSSARAELNAWEVPVDPLVDRPEGEVEDPNETLVIVFSAGTEAEAHIVRGIIEAEGIPVTFDNVTGSAYASAFASAEARFCDLLVPAHLAAAAKLAIASAQSAGEAEGSGAI